VSLLWIGDARDRNLCSGCDDPRATTPWGDLMTGHRFRARSLPPAPVRTGLVKTRCARHWHSHHKPRRADLARATEGGQRLHATRGAWRSTTHIAYLRDWAALKCP
jgi:hypothetical protein